MQRDCSLNGWGLVKRQFQPPAKRALAIELETLRLFCTIELILLAGIVALKEHLLNGLKDDTALRRSRNMDNTDIL